MPAALRIEPLPERDQGYRLVGEVDLSNAAQLQRFAEPGPDLYLDLSGVSFMDSTGLRSLIQVCQARPDHAVVVLNPSAPIKRLFEVTGVDRVDNLRIETG